MANYTKLSCDSRDVVPGTLFFCKGKSFKKEYLLEAARRGAAAYVSETDHNIDLPLIKVDDIRKAMADMANEFYGYAWQAYDTIGITGSKGKSTTLYFLKSIFRATGKKLAFISTIDTDDGIESFESHLTTPEALELHHHFTNARDAKVDAFAMEVSSQGLKYDRTRGVVYTIGAFLNFGKDHIGPDEHSDEEDYFQSKLKLMRQCRTAVINRDSDRFDEILEAAKNSNLCEKIISFSAKEDPFDYEISLPGSFNLENALAAAAMAKELGLPDEAIRTGLAGASVPGRMEIFENREKDLVCIVDYAHSSLSFRRLFEAVKELYPGKRIELLFGCPGGKGLQRRKDLPLAASKYIDFAWITEEDPGLEDSEKICEELKAEFDRLNVPCRISEKREEAVREALTGAAPGTVVVMTGKGREEYMHRGNDYVHYTPDTSQAERYIK